MVLVSCLRSAHELPNLCTIVVSTLWNQYPPRQKSHDNSWDDTRRLEFHTFCQAVLGYLNMSSAVVYTSLKYVQKYLSSLSPSTRKTLMHGSERPIFMVALMLAYKFVEDCGSVDANYWSRASMIPVSALVKMEIDFLCQVSHKLHVDKSAFVRWVNQCNTTFEQQFCFFYTYATGVYPDNSFSYYPPLQQPYPCYVQPTYWYNQQQQQQQSYNPDYRWEQSSTPDSINSNSSASSASTLVGYGHADGDTKYRMPSQPMCYYATDYPRDLWTVPAASYTLMQ
ncbi:hypothetical protein BJV82DRAFT_592934 [Fennellomyces sp. T-0311]|nr:hypothetical protein BJV82DRAFT_592934 [Fennellomyces sp. T-0311]